MKYVPLIVITAVTLYVVGRMLIDYHHHKKAKRSREALIDLANGEKRHG